MDIKQKAIKGVKWSTVSSIVGLSTQFIQYAVLARILTAVEFGLFGMVMVVVGVGLVFADAGIGAAIIQAPKVTKVQLSSLYWVNLLCGLIVCLSVVLITPLAVRFFREPELKNLFYLSSLIFIVSPIGQQFQFLLQRQLEFRVISLAEMSSAVIGRIICIILAILDYGVYSLVVGQLVSSLLRSLLLLLYGRRLHVPRLMFRYSEIKPMVNFGLYILGTRIISAFRNRLDQLLIGYILGATSLGYYNLAKKLTLYPLQRLNPILNRVAFPVYSRIQNETNNLKSVYLKTVKYISLLTFPLIFGLVVLAEPFVSVVYGQEWLAIVPLVQVMGGISIFRINSNPFGSLLLAKGRADWNFKYEVVFSVLGMAVIFWATRMGLMTLVWSLLAFQFFLMVVKYYALFRPLVGGEWKGYFYESFLKVLLLSVAMIVPMMTFIHYSSFSPMGNLILGSLTGFLFYSTFLFFFERDIFNRLFNTVRNQFVGIYRE